MQQNSHCFSLTLGLRSKRIRCELLTSNCWILPKSEIFLRLSVAKTSRHNHVDSPTREDTSLRGVEFIFDLVILDHPAKEVITECLDTDVIGGKLSSCHIIIWSSSLLSPEPNLSCRKSLTNSCL